MKPTLLTAIGIAAILIAMSNIAGCKSGSDAPAQPAATPSTTATPGVQLGTSEQERLRALGYLE